MRVQTEEWRRFIPGVRMYKGKKTYFCNREKIWEKIQLLLGEEERDSLEVIIVLPGVEVIPVHAFSDCTNVKTVIMSDTVKRIEMCAFFDCRNLVLIKLSKNLEYIEIEAFCCCLSLMSIFIPPSCREIEDGAFCSCTKLIILSLPQHTQLGIDVIRGTALIQASPFETDKYGNYDQDDVNEWIKTLNQDEELALHRECASMEPSKDNIYEIIKHRGLPSIYVTNQIGLTAFEYLEKNPYTDIEINEHKLIKRLVLDLMGEINA
ncbi:leucine-rich repeat domain-containing protein [Chaetoceros tenuissimus]|uniref:Leucine-rich repeat domain-containing protein n=1 Tax=Chaetoceros tenuissimus TaxID=426638 RepID=A0AAD3D2I6_9STRA|nr:leucine-rich repeat domain-containing protein [Chaetoceros tenuissimus]